MERLRGGDEIVTRWGPALHSILADLCKTRLLLNCGDVCVSMMEDTVRNMPPLAFGMPVNNTVKDRFILCGLLLSYGDYNKRARSLPRDSR